MFFETGGEPGKMIEIRSDGQGAFQAIGSRPVSFGLGTATFETAGSGYRIHCRQKQVLEISYRKVSVQN